MSDQSYKYIQYQVDRGRARITLNRPDKRNALSIDLVEELRDALWEADDNKDVHCVVIKGAGSAFCAGYDLTAGNPKTDDGVRHWFITNIDLLGKWSFRQVHNGTSKSDII